MNDSERDNVFDSIPEAVDDLRSGKIIVLVDDEDRENEAYLCIAAEAVTSEHVNFMTKHGRGRICLAVDGSIGDKLGLQTVVDETSPAVPPAVTDSVDARSGITTGMSAEELAHTIQSAVSPKAQADDLSMSGYVFPLCAKVGGVLVRAGQTEGSIDIARLAGFRPAAVVCEILKEEESQTQRDKLRAFCDEHELKIVTIADLIKHRMKTERLIERIADTSIPSRYGGLFRAIAFRHTVSGAEHLALIKGDVRTSEPVLVRVHSKCLTGDTLGSLRCDCGEQLHKALEMIADAELGMLLYMDQEGRGIGLSNKLRAYELQDKGLDTVEANRRLGFAADLRDYGLAAQILLDLGVERVKLMTNNPRKIGGLQGYGLEVEKRVPIEIEPGEDNIRYLRAKQRRLGHLLTNV